jgi:NADH-quinone oxidoreductase subunit F
MGAGGYQVLDDTACMVGAALAASRFLATESCGQCPPCKLGSTELTRRLERLEAGVADRSDIDALQYWVRRVSDGNRCYLAVQEQLVVGSAMNTFADELDDHLRLGRCPAPRPVVLPRLLDLRDGVARLVAP